MGPWSDNSSLWTTIYKSQVPDRKLGNDRTFFMKLSDFQKGMAYFTNAYLHDYYNLSYYEEKTKKAALKLTH